MNPVPIRARDLRAGDLLIDAKGNPFPVVHAERQAARVYVSLHATVNHWVDYPQGLWVTIEKRGEP